MNDETEEQYNLAAPLPLFSTSAHRWCKNMHVWTMHTDNERLLVKYCLKEVNSSILNYCCCCCCCCCWFHFCWFVYCKGPKIHMIEFVSFFIGAYSDFIFLHFYISEQIKWGKSETKSFSIVIFTSSVTIKYLNPILSTKPQFPRLTLQYKAA